MSLSIVSSQLVGYLSLYLLNHYSILSLFRGNLFKNIFCYFLTSSRFSIQVPPLSETALLDVLGNQHL